MANHFAWLDLARIAAPDVLEPRGAQPQQPSRLVVRLHSGDHLLHQLVLADLDAESAALPRVSHAGVAAGAHQAAGAGGHGQASLVQGEHRDLEALPFTPHQVLDGHFNLVHLEEPRVAGQDAPLLGQRAAGEALEGSLDDEGADARRIALPLLVEVRPCEDQEVIRHVGERDPHLLARDHVAIAAADSHRLDAPRIAAGRGLGQPVGGDLPALGLRHEIPLLLILGPPRQQRERVEADVDRQDHAKRRVHVLQLLAGQAQ